MNQSTAQRKQQAVVVYILEIKRAGKRKIWHEALPRTTAFAAAKSLAKDGFKPILHKLELTRSQLLSLRPERVELNRKRREQP